VTFGPSRNGYGLFLPDIRDEFGLSTEVLGFMASGLYAGYLAALLAVGLLPARRLLGLIPARHVAVFVPDEAGVAVLGDDHEEDVGKGGG
jgi:hypothetical protein